MNRAYYPRSKPITVGEVYPDGYPIPIGWREVEFRPARHGEWFIGLAGAIFQWQGGTDENKPRVIVERFTPRRYPRRYTVVLEETVPHLGDGKAQSRVVQTAEQK